MRILFLLAAAVLAAGCGGASESAPPATSAADTGGSVAGTTLDGDRISLEEFRGEPVFVNVWSSW
ncbi:MAG TPA: hypothetical protein VNT58_02870 [Gaiellaceae bacterium]|nr:hypothetical protein [Gaiellaceae bacterium]